MKEATLTKKGFRKVSERTYKVYRDAGGSIKVTLGPSCFDLAEGRVSIYRDSHGNVLLKPESEEGEG